MASGYMGGESTSGPTGAGAKPKSGMDPLERMASGYMGGGSCATVSEGAGKISWAGGIND